MVIQKEILVKLRMIVDDFTKPMKDANAKFDKHFTKAGDFNKNYAKANNVLTKFGARMRYMIKSVRGFRMGLLGVAFSMQMVGRSMSSLLSPALEAAGVFQIFGAMLTLVFLPFALFMQDLALKLFDFFTSLPEPVQKFINVFVPLLALVALVTSVIAFLGITAGVISGLAVIVGVVAAIAAAFTLWEPIYNIVMTVRGWVLNLIGAIGELIGWIVDKLQPVWQPIVNAIQGVINILIELKKWFSETFPNMPNPFTALLGFIGLVVESVKGLINWLGEAIGKRNELSPVGSSSDVVSAIENPRSFGRGSSGGPVAIPQSQSVEGRVIIDVRNNSGSTRVPLTFGQNRDTIVDLSNV